MMQLQQEQGQQEQPCDRSWRLDRRVLPQHTDHAGIMWHGAYLAWLEEARVEALAATGLAYSELAERGLALPVVALSIEYRRPLLHGEAVRLVSEVLPRRGVRIPWRTRFLGAGGGLAAEARVELVVVDLRAGAAGGRPLRRYPDDLARALEALGNGPQGL